MSGPLPSFLDLLLDAVFMVDTRGRIVYVSAACERILGYTPAEMLGRTMIDLVVPEDRARTWEEAMQVMAGKPRVGFENRYIHKDGRHVRIMWSARWSEADQLRIGVARDVTERRRAEERQAATYAISEAAHVATDLVNLFREIHRIVATLVPTAGFAVAMFDAPDKSIRFPYQMDLQGDSTALRDQLSRQLCGQVAQDGQPVLLPEVQPRETGSESACDGNAGASWLAVPLLFQQGVGGALILKSVAGIVYSEQDKDLLQYVAAQVATAVERRRLHAELLRAARYDELTGLPNRRQFQDQLKSALARARRRGQRLALLYLDVDNFKQVNDSLGHAAGDLLLQEVARRMKGCVREEDMVARLSGDEFAVLLEGIQSYEAAAAVIEKIGNALAQPLAIENARLDVRQSAGIALFPDHGADAEELLRHADTAMYAEKNRRRDQIRRSS